jgi:catechol 2,3-dioxygenase-like lactoylglutathione lyase family enzyme
MFTVADQDAALAFYTEKLGFEVRADTRFGEQGEMRWVEVAPPGSTARLALNPPMFDKPGGGSIASKRRTFWASTPAYARSAASTSTRSRGARPAPR